MISCFEIEQFLLKADKHFNSINIEKTKQLDQNEKYKNFMSWFIKNGGKLENIQFPSIFGIQGYVGVSVNKNV